jgi:hypothetical protein
MTLWGNIVIIIVIVIVLVIVIVIVIVFFVVFFILLLVLNVLIHDCVNQIRHLYILRLDLKFTSIILFHRRVDLDLLDLVHLDLSWHLKAYEVSILLDVGVIFQLFLHDLLRSLYFHLNSFLS